ncbi:MAG TPA: DMT family transporter [Jiangellales bacterium]|nr:DMT family transporter [Jiangellales bacterium]
MRTPSDALRAGPPAALAAAALFGTAGTAQALGPAGTTPMGVGAVRLLLGGLVLAVLVQATGGWSGRSRDLWRRPVVLAAAASVATYQVAFFAGVERAGVAVGTLVAVGSAPVAAGLLAWPVLGRRPTPTWAVATAIGVAGLAALCAGGGAGEGASTGSGVLLALAAGASIACFSVLAARAMPAGGPRLPFLATSFLVAAAALVPLALAQPLGWLLEPSGMLLALHLGVVTMAVANVAYARGLAALGPGPTSTLLLAEPVVASVLAVAVLREPLTLPTLVGAGLVVAALGVQGAGVTRLHQRPCRGRTARTGQGIDVPRTRSILGARSPSGV